MGSGGFLEEVEVYIGVVWLVFMFLDRVSDVIGIVRLDIYIGIIIGIELFNIIFVYVVVRFDKYGVFNLYRVI